MAPVVLLGVDTFSKFWNLGLTELTMIDLVNYTSSFSCFATDLLPKSWSVNAQVGIRSLLLSDLVP
jgi:hypothetical protein